MRPVIRIAADALQSIRTTIAASESTLETGGAIFGHERTLHITHAAGPGPAAVHQPHYFLRDLAYTQHIANELYAADRSEWIGEWHTHPYGPAEPSTLDLGTYAGHVTDPELRFDHFVALICQLNAPSVRIAAWVIRRTDRRIDLLPADVEIKSPDEGALRR